MGFRLRKSVKILPGVRINLSKSGTSVSVGGRGFTTNVSKRGARTTLGIPGTGISYSHKHQTNTSNNSSREATISASNPSDGASRRRKLALWSALLFLIILVILLWSREDNLTQAIALSANPSTVSQTPLQPNSAGQCSRSPEQIFAVKARLSRDEITRRLEISCPGAFGGNFPVLLLNFQNFQYRVEFHTPSGIQSGYVEVRSIAKI